MGISPVFVLLIGWLASFTGTLPLGPINLSVVEVTVNRSFRAAIWLSVAAALVEIFQSLLALTGTHWLGATLAGPEGKLASFIIFLALGLVFFFRKTAESAAETPSLTQNRRGRHFLQGLVVAALNPQAIPFWLFTFAYLDSAHIVHLDLHLQLTILLSFLIGVSAGKLSALMLYASVSRLLRQRITAFNSILNKAIGIILIGIGLYQGLLATVFF